MIDYFEEKHTDKNNTETTEIKSARGDIMLSVRECNGLASTADRRSVPRVQNSTY